MKKIVFILTTVSCIALANRESGGRYAATAVFIEFGSLGSGVDINSENVLLKYVHLAKQKQKVTEVQHQQKGREGESLYCVRLRTAFDRWEMIKAIAPSILNDRAETGSVRTRVLVGFDCQDYLGATEQDLKAILKQKQ